jgi:hypothetical protein
MRFTRLLLLVLAVGAGFLWRLQVVSAVPAVNPGITFNSFAGVYHLSRDSKGLSLLTTEETILADFPANGSFYGITRDFAKNYQGRSVDIKIISVSDAGGNPVPYKTSASGGNLALVTGNPKINLYGTQTFRISYQTHGVVNLSGNSDEFLLNVNGRGWNQPFGKVDAFVHVPKSFSGRLASEPSCYLVLDTTKNNNCQISSKIDPQETIINSRAENLAPHQALVVKMDFQPATFTNKKSSNAKFAIAAGLIIVLATSVPAYNYLKNRK